MATSTDDLINLKDEGETLANKNLSSVNDLLKIETDPEKITVLEGVKQECEWMIRAHEVYRDAEWNEDICEMDWDLI